jgi:hypothetical protein
MKETVKILGEIKNDLVQIKSESPEITSIRDKITLQISDAEKTSKKDLISDQSLVQVGQEDQGDIEDI